MADATAQVTPPTAIIDYTISIDGSDVVTLAITVNLNTLETSGSYTVAPSPSA
jgi:hypothetical protein